MYRIIVQIIKLKHIKVFLLIYPIFLLCVLFYLFFILRNLIKENELHNSTNN